VSKYPWEKQQKCRDCGEDQCPHESYQQWRDWLFEQVEDQFDEIGEIALCQLYSIMFDLIDKKTEL
jgi:hypothetical protein